MNEVDNLRSWTNFRPRSCRYCPSILHISLSHLESNFGEETEKSNGMFKFLESVCLQKCCGCCKWQLALLIEFGDSTGSVKRQFLMIGTGEGRLWRPATLKCEFPLLCMATSSPFSVSKRSFLWGRRQPPSSLSDEESRLAY